ncbi:MAG: hypothetical protein ABI585_13620 [Betaproteobacteria bacterium]
MTAPGFLAVFSDVDAGHEIDYVHWLTREHVKERVSTPGFVGGRVFRALDDRLRRYLILYDLQSAEVLASDAYLKKLERPSAWSQRTMPRLRRFIRGGGTISASAGDGQGAFLAVVEVDDAHRRPARAEVEALAANDRIAAVRVLVVDTDRTSIRTHEKSLRSGDASFAALVLVEATGRDAARHALEGPPGAPSSLEGLAVTFYAQVFSRAAE